MRTYALAFMMCVAVACCRAADIGTAHGVVASTFHTLQMAVNDDFMALPVIALDGFDRLTVSFDELSDTHRYLRYSVVHCNHQWQPDGHLADSEILEGFNEGTVDDWEYSRGTVVHYVHYKITLPDENFSFKASGNYLLRVYDESDSDAVLLQVRFFVAESVAAVESDVSACTDIDYLGAHQQLSIEVDTRSRDIAGRLDDVVVVVGQNGRYDNEVTAGIPTTVTGTTLRYEHMPSLIFDAGNEYRRMETVSLLVPGMHVAEIAYVDTVYEVWLDADFPRDEYAYDQTQSGRYVVRNSEVRGNSDTEADYVLTHFQLESPHIPDADVFIEGDLTCRALDGQSLMEYNPATGCYEKSLLLKQGSYNYQYLTVKNGESVGKTGPMEGDFHPTLNEYVVKVYYRPHGSRYDRLLCVRPVIFQQTN